MTTATFPYRLQREGVVMTADPAREFEQEGVLNPASGWGTDGQLYLLPRMVAEGNVSRVGLVRVNVVEGTPTSVERLRVVLHPTHSWERASGNAGVEDPRVTWIRALGLHVMTYVAFGPLGPRTAIAVSSDLLQWERLGPVLYRWDEESEVDLNLYHNRDAVFFGEPVTAPDGVRSLAVLHRPMGLLRPFHADDPPTAIPPGPHTDRQSIWISFLPLADVRADPRQLTLWAQHRFLAGPKYSWEALKIGGGPPPLRVAEGWLVLHHGVSGIFDPTVVRQQHVHYAVGGLLVDAEQPWQVLNRATEPLMGPETTAERVGTVPNVVFPTASVEIDGSHFIFYGMADSAIGVARLIRRT